MTESLKGRNSLDPYFIFQSIFRGMVMTTIKQQLNNLFCSRFRKKESNYNIVKFKQ